MTDTYRITKRDAGSGSAGPDEWGSAVASGDATKLAQLVLVWSGSKPERALSILRDCVSLLEREVAFSAPASSPLPSPPVTPEPSHSSCLNAIAVALDETCDGTSWYTSTKELQLASLEFCEACRNHQTLHLTVDPHTPRSLLAAADAPPPHPNRLCPTRVPRLRARRVTWNMPTAAELSVPKIVMADVDRLEFGLRFDGSLDVVAWPCKLETVVFCRRSTFDQPMEQVAWPASLQKLTFGALFDQPIEAANFPASLKQLAFGANSLFNQPVGRMVWPTSLQKLTFGQCFDRPVEEVVWPASLLQLTFGNEFNQPVEGTSLPDSLQTLVFGERFNQPVDNVRWPSSLQEVAFGCCEGTWKYRTVMCSEFNQRIGSSAWPASLRRLTLGHNFKQSLQGLGTWMPNLETFRLLDNGSGGEENSLLRGIEWPKALRHLTVFGDSSFDIVEVPTTVQVLFAYDDY